MGGRRGLPTVAIHGLIGSLNPDWISEDRDLAVVFASTCSSAITVHCVLIFCRQPTVLQVEVSWPDGQVDLCRVFSTPQSIGAADDEELQRISAHPGATHNIRLI